MSVELAITYTETAKLIPYVNNAKLHEESQIKAIASSIREFGFNDPVGVDGDNGIIEGHGRVLAAQKLGLDKVPTIELSHLTDAQKKAYILAHNRLAEVGTGWDLELVKLELQELDDLDFDIDLTGFGDLDFGEMTEGLTDDDAVPELGAEAISKYGDVWILGNHRVMCGDSTMVDDVDRLMSSEKADMVFTDPPYGMSYGGGRKAGSSRKGDRVKAHGMIKNDDLQGDDLINLVKDSISLAASSAKDGAAIYVCFTWRTYAEFEDALKASGKDVKACIVWDKKSIGLGNSNYRPQHEFIFYCGGQWHGNKSESDVWHMSRGSAGEYVHPTQKPVELIEKALLNSSKSGDVVIDVFGGSGSTLIACEKSNRNARLVELDPKYCDVIIKRWQDFTGKEATHLDNGKSFNSLG